MSVSHPTGERTSNKRSARLSGILARIIWLCMLPLFVVATILAVIQIRQIHRDQLKTASFLAKNVVLYTDNAINSRIMGLNMLATSPNIDDLSKWDLLYQEAQSFYKSFGTHVVISDGAKQPQLLLNTRVPYGSELPVVKDSDSRLAGPTAMRTGLPAVSDLFDGPVAKEPLIGIAVPVLRRGAPRLAILTVLSTDFFRNQIEQVSLPSGWHLALKDAQGNIIAAMNNPPLKNSSSHLIARSTVSNWQVEIEIPPLAYWKPMLSATFVLVIILLGAALTGFLSGKWVGRRVGGAIESLAGPDSSNSNAHDEILEIAAARRLIRKTAEGRLAIENELRDKMLEYEAIFERSVVGKALADPASGRFLKVNQAFADMLGYSTDELCGIAPLEITHPDDHEAKISGFEAVRTGRADQWHDEKRYLKKDGTPIWVSVSGNLIHFGHGQPDRTIAVIQDITERKSAAEALRASEQKYRELVEAANSIILRWDRQGTIRFINDFGLRSFGYSADELIGQDVMILVPRVERSSGRDMEALVKEILRHPENHTYVPNENITKDGQTMWVAWTNKAILDDHGQVLEILAIGNDITALKEYGQALDLSEKRYRTFFENSMDAVLLTGPDGAIFSANRAACDMLGWSEEELRQLGRGGIVDLSDPHLAGALEEQSRTGVFKGELTYLRKDGSTFPGEVTSAVYDGPEGESRTSMIIRDVSDRKQAEDAIKRQYELLIGINRIFETVVTSASDEEFGMACLAVAEKLTGSTISFIGEIGRDGLLHDIAISNPAWRVCDMVDSKGQRKPPGNFHIHGLYGSVLSHGTPLLTNDPAAHPESIGLPPGHPPLTSFMGVPLKEQDTTIGMVAVGNRQSGYSAHELEALEAIAPVIYETLGRRRAEAALRASLAEKEVLLKEIHHRVKNNMQVISSLVDLQADRTSDPGVRAIFNDMIYRVHTMAIVHEKLYKSIDLAQIDFADYAHSLLEYLWRAQDTGASAIHLDQQLQPVLLPVNVAVPCGLILNEIFSNALKHAFTGRKGGTVTLALEESPEGRVNLCIRDDGNGLPPGLNWEQSPSLGLLIVRTLVRQLNGSLEVASANGTEFSISFQKDRKNESNIYPHPS